MDARQIGFKYKSSYFVPKTMVNTFHLENTHKMLKLDLMLSDELKLRCKTESYYLEYFDKGSKRLAFRSLKLIASTIKLASQTENLDDRFISTNGHILYKLVEDYSRIFSIPLNGISSFQFIKDMIKTDILKDIDFDNRNRQLKLYDIEMGSEFAKIREFDVRH